MSTAILVEGLVKSYNRVPVLRGVSFSVRPGEVYGLLGPNGAGKTTTLKSLVGLVRPDDGRIELCGYNVATHRLQALSCTGYVPELTVGFDYLSVREFLEFVSSLRGLRWAEVEDYVERLVNLFELERYMDEFMGKLSRGTVQKALVISALMSRPKVLVMDEPTSGMDPESQRVFREEVSRLAREGAAVVLSSHLLYNVERLCTRVGILHKGVIITEGSIDEVRRKAATGENSTLEDVFLLLTRGEGY
ncbi:ABC transporter ATP-binding protein [Infirmifilum uzonense]|jgi:ABC-2 type transport system ATP-binding protein|uniref:ABC transporter ATP-binding protein n=1 Tax=Infirmifilum TaxID=2856573 RepID=UPI0023575145